MARLFPPGYTFFKAGKALKSGTVTFYSTGTTDKKNTYPTTTLSGTANANPITLNSSGQLPVDVHGSGEYTVLIQDVNGATVESRSNVSAHFHATVSIKDYGGTGDGSTDDTAALLAAATAGDVVMFPPGTYLISSVILPSSSIELIGSGPSSIIKPSATAETRCIDARNLTDVRVKDLKFDWTTSGAATYILDFDGTVDWSVEGCHFAGDTANLDNIAAVFAKSTTTTTKRARAINNTFVDINAENVRIQNAEEVIITGNFFRNVKKASGLSNRPIIVGQSDRVVISNNVIDTVEAVSTMYGIDAGNADDITISNNIIYNAAGGINIENLVQKCVVANNVMTGNFLSGMHGIQFNVDSDEPEDFIISGNVISDFDDGIRCNQADDITITGNVITNCYNRSIFNSTSQDTRQMTITGNTFANNCTVASGVAFDVIMQDSEDRGGLIANNVFNEAYPLRCNVSGSATCILRFQDNQQLGAGAFVHAGSVVKGNMGTTSRVTFTDADTTPTVAGSHKFNASNTGGTTITDFDGGGAEHQIEILFTNANTTVSNNANIKLKGAANWTPPANSTLTLVQVGTIWYEVSRSDTT